MSKEYNCVLVRVKDKNNKEFNVLYDKSRQMFYTTGVTVEFAKEFLGWEIEEAEGENNE